MIYVVVDENGTYGLGKEPEDAVKDLENHNPGWARRIYEVDLCVHLPYEMVPVRVRADDLGADGDDELMPQDATAQAV